MCKKKEDNRVSEDGLSGGRIRRAEKRRRLWIRRRKTTEYATKER